jgi:D-sedoheptulose 7-phosphate isomerase
LDSDIREKLQRGIGAVPLSSLSALSTAFSNDVDPALTFAQGVFALGQKNDVLLGLSTSGNAKNVIAALKVAKAMGLKTIAMTGESGGKMKALADITLTVPETETYKVQQLHLPAYHAICAEAERILFEKEA